MIIMLTEGNILCESKKVPQTFCDILTRVKSISVEFLADEKNAMPPPQILQWQRQKKIIRTKNWPEQNWQRN